LDKEATPVGSEEKVVVEQAPKTPRNLPKGQPQKIDKPVPKKAYRGTHFVLEKFRWEDNTHIKIRKWPYKRGNPEPFIITLYSPEGRPYIFKPLGQDAIDWDDAPSVTKKNRWFNQVIKKRLVPDNSQPPERERGQIWTILEKDNLIERVKNRILEVRRELTGYDVSAILLLSQKRNEKADNGV
jgi:Arc/MetJ-type ribon-helix-helix transcriptional regulator